MPEPDRGRARELAAESLAAGDPTGWFEKLYKEQERGSNVVPWADRGANPNLLEFFERNPVAPGTALVVGCGYGDDAEQLAAWNFKTTAFDVSPSAIRACRARFPDSRVSYEVADLLAPPDEWVECFDFVFESNTLQALPPEVRSHAAHYVAKFPKKGGSLLILARGREESDPAGQLPWPLTRRELDQFVESGLKEVSFEDYLDRESPPVRRFRALYRR